MNFRVRRRYFSAITNDWWRLDGVSLDPWANSERLVENIHEVRGVVQILDSPKEKPSPVRLLSLEDQ